MVSVVAKKLHKARQEKGRYNVKFCFKRILEIRPSVIMIHNQMN